MNSRTQARHMWRSPQTARGAIQGAWPPYVVVLVLIAAAIYAFSPRPMPPFPPTQIHPQGLQINGLVHSAKYWVAVGEQGRILIADKPDGAWREASVEPQRGSLLTQVLAVDANTLVAVGHDGWIVRSRDAGETWQEVSFATESSDPYLGVAGPFDGKLYAFGAFGLFAVSTDRGQSWQKEALVEIGASNAAAAPAAEVDPYADPFANLSAASGGISDHHFNAMASGKDGTLVLVGERGLIARSTDKGASWKAVQDVYNGSFYGVHTLPDQSLLAFGMRGNVFRSEDAGLSWVASPTPLPLSVYQAAVTTRKEVVLVGENSVVMVSQDGGRKFLLGSLGGQQRTATALPLGDGKLLIGGEGGLSVQNIYTKKKTKGSANGDAS